MRGGERSWLWERGRWPASVYLRVDPECDGSSVAADAALAAADGSGSGWVPSPHPVPRWAINSLTWETGRVAPTDTMRTSRCPHQPTCRCHQSCSLRCRQGVDKASPGCDGQARTAQEGAVKQQWCAEEEGVLPVAAPGGTGGLDATGGTPCPSWRPLQQRHSTPGFGDRKEGRKEGRARSSEHKSC